MSLIKKMAVARNSTFSRKDLLQDQDLFNTAEPTRPKSFSDKAKATLEHLISENSSANSDIFVTRGVEQLKNLHHQVTRHSRVEDRRLLHTLATPIYPAPILERESRLWLDSLWRRLSAKRSIRTPYYTQISRDIPYEIFAVIKQIVRALDGFVEPFCFRSNNKKAEVVSFTSVRLVNELFALLSGLSKDAVAKYFKRTLAGSRNGHTVAVIVTEVKDFSFIYKVKCGKLVIGFNFGEWNANGFPQHSQ